MQQWVATFRGGRQGVSDVLRHGIVGETLAQIQWLICHSQFDVLIPLRERKKNIRHMFFRKNELDDFRFAYQTLGTWP